MKKIGNDELRTLLAEEESTYLDFKLKHHDNVVEMVHDILSLSNSDAQSDRFLIFGVNNRKEIEGLEGQRKTQADITDSLRASHINKMPDFLLYTLQYQNKEIDILHILNNSMKPYFLLKDKKSGRIIIRAGVIYTRDNDTNTPIVGTATEAQIIRMWEERFGLNNPPLKRSYKYLMDIGGWKSSSEHEFFYETFPEFRLVWESEDTSNQFMEHWVDKKLPPAQALMTIKLYYHTTVMKSFYAVNVEYRSYFPVPRYYDLTNARENGAAYILRDHIETYICAIIDGTQGLDHYDEDFKRKENVKTPLDVYITSTKMNFAVYSLNVNFEDMVESRHYQSKDRDIYSGFF